MDKRYQVEELVQTGPDDAEWEPQASFDDRKDADVDAMKKVKATEHGPSGVRVYDSIAQIVVWDNV